MSVVGSWSEEEIRASYALTNTASIVSVLTILMSCGAIRIWGGSKMREFLVAWGSSLLCCATYVYLVQTLARALCIDAPLYVKVQGMVNIPFFLGTQGLGILVTEVMFASVSVLALRVKRHERTCIWAVPLLNGVLLLIVSAVALTAYVAVGFGIERSG